MIESFWYKLITYVDNLKWGIPNINFGDYLKILILLHTVLIVLIIVITIIKTKMP